MSRLNQDRRACDQGLSNEEAWKQLKADGYEDL